ncbi:MAG: GntR family transcriptional regulator [Betaproteobacteria bacterium]|nr:GntR family transcriptional regulator [Betaproteobacteria bacterium]
MNEIVAETAPDALNGSASSPDLVVSAIERGILYGRFVPGQRLIEADLTRDLKVSRGPVREALKRLAAEGVVALTPRRGAYIRALTRIEVLDLLQVLQAIMRLAVGMAAARIRRDRSSKQHGYAEKLANAYELLKNQGASGDRVLQSIARTRFYDAILEIAGNRELVRINPVVPTQILRMQVHSFLPQQTHQRQFDDYQRLYNALIAGDPKQAKWVVSLHIRRSRIQMLHLSDEAFAPAQEH